jgi:hypothetical protein
LSLLRLRDTIQGMVLCAWSQNHTCACHFAGCRIPMILSMALTIKYARGVATEDVRVPSARNGEPVSMQVAAPTSSHATRGLNLMPATPDRHQYISHMIVWIFGFITAWWMSCMVAKPDTQNRWGSYNADLGFHLHRKTNGFLAHGDMGVTQTDILTVGCEYALGMSTPNFSLSRLFNRARVVNLALGGRCVSKIFVGMRN